MNRARFSYENPSPKCTTVNIRQPTLFLFSRFHIHFRLFSLFSFFFLCTRHTQQDIDINSLAAVFGDLTSEQVVASISVAHRGLERFPV